VIERWALLALLLSPIDASAGAWTRDAGRFYLNASYSRIAADALFTPSFEKVPIVPYTQQLVGSYGEVGLITRWRTVTGEGTIFRHARLEGQGATSGVGDLRLGAWTGLLEQPLRLSLGVLLGLPTGDRAPSAGAGADSEAQAIARSLPTGDGEWDVEARAALGTSLASESWPLEHYVTLEAGYWVRTRGFSDGLTYKLEIGTKIPVFVLDRFWFVLRLSGLESFASTAEAGQDATGLGNGVTYLSPGLEISAKIYQGLGVAAAIDTAVRARSVAAAPQIKLAISYEW